MTGTTHTGKTTSHNASSHASGTMTSARFQRNMQTTSVLREVISKVTASCRRDLENSSSEVLQETKESGVVLDFIAAERLRCYPHPGSKYDKVLRWAESYVSQIYAFSQTVNEFVMYSSEAAHLMFGGSLLLLQQVCLGVFEKSFRYEIDNIRLAKRTWICWRSCLGCFTSYLSA